MASTFPTSLDSFTNPTATSLLTSPSHAQQHSDINDAVEALEAKVAIGNTVLGTYTAYTPTFTNITVGNGTIVGAYARVNKFVHVYGTITFGSTTTVAGQISLVLPVTISAGLTAFPYGMTAYRDASTTAIYPGLARFNGTTNSVFITSYSETGSTVILAVPNATVPFTWTTSDIISWNLYYEAA
jgi:hypothetical protein